VTTVEAVVFPGYIKLMAELSLSQYSGWVAAAEYPSRESTVK
jgi:hypothetical protein